MAQNARRHHHLPLTMVANTFRLEKKIGQGSFGDIYRGRNIKTGEPVAIKIERRELTSSEPQLPYEYELYRALGATGAGAAGMPFVYYFGIEHGYNVLIMDLLGKSLELHFQECERTFSLKTVLLIADQLICLIEHIHAKSFIYRDIKSENFLSGAGKNSKYIFIIDFGLSKRYIDRKTRAHIPFRQGRELTGTARYCSINAHLGYELSRRDDMEAIGHLLIYFLRGSLPWSGLPGKTHQEKFNNIRDTKMNTPISSLCAGLPKEFAEYLRYARSLRFDERPDYVYLRTIFSDLFYSKGYSFDYRYDWTLNQNRRSQQMVRPHEPPMLLIIAGKYRLGPKIGSGSFGDIYRGVNIKSNTAVAIKVESSLSRDPQLPYEFDLYHALGATTTGASGLPFVYWFGRQGDWNMLVMDLLGKSLEEHFQDCNCRFTLKTTLMIADQLLRLIEHIHSKNFIYRDVKSENFMTGTSVNSLFIYIIDFGLSKRFIDPKTGLHIAKRTGRELTGTARYCSINAHLGIELSRRDDMEAIGHLLIYFMRGSLPWSGLPGKTQQEKFNNIRDVKRATPIHQLCANMPAEFSSYLKYSRGLRFDEAPNYQYCRKLFSSLFQRMGYHFDYRYDWIIKEESRISNPSTQKATGNRSDLAAARKTATKYPNPPVQNPGQSNFRTHNIPPQQAGVIGAPVTHPPNPDSSDPKSSGKPVPSSSQPPSGRTGLRYKSNTSGYTKSKLFGSSKRSKPPAAAGAPTKSSSRRRSIFGKRKY